MQEPTADPRETEEVFSPEELCVFAKISLDTLQRYRRAGQGPPELKVGAAVRFLKTDIIDWLKSLRVLKDAEPTGPQGTDERQKETCNAQIP